MESIQEQTVIGEEPAVTAGKPGIRQRLAAVKQGYYRQLDKVWNWLGLDRRHQRYFLNALWLALTIRAIFFPLAYYAGRVISKNGDGLWPLFYNVLSRWDTLNYYYLANNGYTPYGDEQKFIVFFPVFPWLLRSLGYIFLNPLTPALLIGLVASVVGGYYLQALVGLDYDDETAHRALKYFFLFPTAYFLAVPYTEALFMALTLGSWYNARIGRWGVAGIAGLLSCLTRLTGLVLFPALLIEAWYQRRQTPWPRMLGVLLVPVGFALYLLLNWKVMGDPLAFTHMQDKYWGNKMVPPWQPLQTAWTYVSGHAGPPTGQGTGVEVARLAAFVVTFVSLLLGIRRMRLSYQFYAWAQFAMVMLSSWLMSLPRYVLCLFPLYIIYATQSRSEEFHFRLTMASTLAMGAFAFLFFTGYWAF